ncbi:amidase [Nocardiopsis ansamitocini]|uniref:Amidase n=1 Tax=Nocardiopsis ansamitocini TaxID=1670832 RepID=A0A9W6UJW2_9ACTN|nr:amidase family protein [Nocardiopsis ansamitocini]GLU49112.1 amidase [Nocardiopsis ansamitocini]
MNEPSTPVTALQIRSHVADNPGAAEKLVAERFQLIRDVEPRINAMASLREDAARADAQRVDSTPRLRGESLAGVPVVVKDVHEVAGLPFSNGSGAITEYVPDFDTEAVRRLKEAGAVILGGTVMPEFGLRATTENARHGATCNPWNLEFGPGGSSGGAAAAVAAGLAPLALAADGGGSGRAPAAACGIVGIKPTRGRIPWGPSAFEHWAGLAISSPMARTVRDAALMLDVVSGPMTGDPYGLPLQKAGFFLNACDRAPEQLRIAWTLAPPHGEMDAGIAESVRHALTVFDKLPHSLSEDTPELKGMLDSFLAIMAGNVAALVESIPVGELGKVEPTSLDIARHGERMTAGDYCAAVSSCRVLSARVLGFWDRYDVLVTPTTTRPPYKTGEGPKGDRFAERWREYADMLAFGYPFNMTGQPAISIPCGVSEHGVPVGMQLVGRPGAEDVLLSLAAQIEELRPWDGAPPVV